MSFVSGAQVGGKYRLGKLLGEGGFGQVFAAHDDSLDRDVALKFLRPEHAAKTDVLQRFLQEARSAARIVHPGIVTIFECGELPDEGIAYIAMELLHGESLTSRLERARRLAPATVLEIGRQLASALDAAHRAGIVHRDLKPDNIFLVPDATALGGTRVKVLDFGIAKLAGPAPSAVQTNSAMVFGTPRYMSPEQCVSAANVDHRSDIYTLGCILYEMLSGKPPFDGTAGELVAFHMLMEPPALATVARDVPADLAELVGRMLAKQPTARPAAMADVQRALERCGALPAGQAATVPPDGHIAAAALPNDTVVESRPVTTLSSVAGAGPVTVERPRTTWPIYAGAAALALVLPIVLVLALRSGGEASTPSAPSSPAPAAVTTPEPSPPKPVVTPPPSSAGSAVVAPPKVTATKPPVAKPAPVVGRIEHDRVPSPAPPPKSKPDTHVASSSKPPVVKPAPTIGTIERVLVEPPKTTPPPPAPPPTTPPAPPPADPRNQTINPFKRQP